MLCPFAQDRREDLDNFIYILKGFARETEILECFAHKEDAISPFDLTVIVNKKLLKLKLL
jgi:hypothetical protein